MKRWLAKVREQKSVVLRRSVISVLSLTAVVGAVYLSKPLLWSGGFGIGKDQAVTAESVEIDAGGNITKTVKMTKYDDGKTLWDWLSLLGVPVSLAILGFWLQQNQQKRAEKVAQEQKKRDEEFARKQKDRDEKIAQELREHNEKFAQDQREIAAEETKEEILQSYFDRLSVLLIDNNLFAIAAKVYPTVMPVILPVDHPKIEATLEERELFYSAVELIRARTLSTLRRFENDPERKTSVIRFLIEADIIRLLEINLKDADLSGAYLNYADLSNAYLNYANLSGADLNYANLSNAYLMFANLSGSKLYKANLKGADLRVANLSGAELYEADLSGTDLESADLSGATFRNNPGLSDAAKANMREYGAIFMN